MTKKMEKRKEWDDIWMTLAESLAQRSGDPKHKVGVCIVDGNNQAVLSIGYNGDHKGGSNKRLSLEHGKSGFIHAEANALIKLDFNDPRRQVMYTTLSPCYACAQMIINAGIDEVIFLEHYCKEGTDLLEDCGITVIKYT